VHDFEIPKHWPRAFGMDAGGGTHPTAAVWGALNRETQVLNIYSTYKRVSAEPVLHAESIKARGAWVPGVGDTAALIVNREDAEQLIQVYRKLGLDLELPDKAVETGIYDVWSLMAAGRLKIFASCQNLFEELRLYHRDEKWRIVKLNDDLWDALRYLVRSGLARAKTAPVEVRQHAEIFRERAARGRGWMRG
jgi:hypothetical protein